MRCQETKLHQCQPAALVDNLICMCMAALILFVCLLASVLPAHAQTVAQREFYLNPLIYPHRYAPAKNSFIFQNLKRGERKTLADVKGSGSLRHFWTTWARSFDLNAIAEDGKVLLHIFVDGEKSPAVSGTIDEVFRAAEATGDRYVPEPAFNYEGAFNIYLPVFFQRGLRVEIEALDDLEEFYAQLDYRITARSESEARLVSRRTASGTIVKYVGRGAPSFGSRRTPAKEPPWQNREVTLAAGSERDALELEGPAILRGLTIEGESIAALDLLIFWDNEPAPGVSASLKYLFGGFDTLALQSAPGKFTCYFPMPFRKSARIRIRNQDSLARRMTIRYSLERNAKLPAGVRFFHARFSEAEQTTGYRDFTALDAHGKGHFVGVSLFDSGHNHGGGDTALIDAETLSPRVLHGINGEDYFSFAWHKTGRMHLFAGAPQHERRYRFHLENPYPFHTSLRFDFGIFAGLNPKAVAFWYQLPGPAGSPARGPRRRSAAGVACGQPGWGASSQLGNWRVPNARWKVFGPVDETVPIPEKIDGRTYDAEVTLAKPEQFKASWQEAEMVSGFLDLTHHYRHFLTTTKGTGFVAGSCQSKAVTYVYTPEPLDVEAVIGHDDRLQVSVNDEKGITLPEQTGFHPARVTLKLRRGWNKLSVLIHNRENITWRWAGISLALAGDHRKLGNIKFSAAPLD